MAEQVVGLVLVALLAITAIGIIVWAVVEWVRGE